MYPARSRSERGEVGGGALEVSTDGRLDPWPHLRESHFYPAHPPLSLNQTLSAGGSPPPPRLRKLYSDLHSVTTISEGPS